MPSKMSASASRPMSRSTIPPGQSTQSRPIQISAARWQTSPPPQSPTASAVAELGALKSRSTREEKLVDLRVGIDDMSRAGELCARERIGDCDHVHAGCARCRYSRGRIFDDTTIEWLNVQEFRCMQKNIGGWFAVRYIGRTDTQTKVLAQIFERERRIDHRMQ